MLHALELNGFKSFADRTRFDFPRGTTVVVGPNGSGKSNVVDAVKWVLGAQSVKSLRGKEMTDVIFSGSKSRRQAGAAEVTLIFDNTSRLLSVDQDEISVARRVLRSGESEYLINRQTCRLRDIQDLLAKIGVSSGSYTIIEQGKVDALLQASPQERRVIFEEAAGISRFRSKRQEAERRLQRIEQNLLRLSDIVEEVGSRLKAVRSQAGRARKYKELRQQLEALQLQVAIHRCREIDAQSLNFRGQLDAVGRQETSLQRDLDACEESLSDAESTDRRLQSEIRQLASKDAAVRERIAKCESSRAGQLSRLDDNEGEQERFARQSLLLAAKVAELEEQLAQVDSDLGECQTQHRVLEQGARKRNEEFDLYQQKLRQCNERQERAAADVRTRTEELSQLRSDLATHCSRLESAQESLAQLERQITPIREQRDRLAAESAELDAFEKQAEQDLSEATRKVEMLRSRLARDRSRLQKTQSLLAETRGQLSGVKQRSSVLEELEHRLGGLNVGARETLRRASEDPTGPLAGVRGVVADLFHVDADTAPLIEIALGDRANHIVLADARPLAECLAELEGQWRSRTSFLRLDVPVPASAIDRVDLSDDPGVMGRADSFVETSPQFAPLAKRLLGRYWIVDKIATALRLADGRGRGLNFITLAGESIAGDGVVSVGPHQSLRGLLSRRTELARLKEQLEELQQQSAQIEDEALRIETQIASDEQQCQTATQRLEQCSRTHSDLSLRAANAREKLQHAQQQLDSIQGQLQESTLLVARSREQQDACQVQISENREAQEALQSHIDQAHADKQSLEHRIQLLRHANTEARIELAKCEQRRTSLQAHVDQLAGDTAERRGQLHDARQRLSHFRGQQTDLIDAALTHSSEIADLYREKDQFQLRLAALDGEQEAAAVARDAMRSDAAETRRRLGLVQQQRQKLEMTVLQLQQQRDAVAASVAACDHDNLQAAIDSTPNDLDFNVDAVESEISELQSQLSAGGPVNLEALEELQALEERHATLSGQSEDMQTAKARLQQINARMSARCGQLYLATIENVRQHFQEVFRALFGGGEADIVLEPSEDADPLSAGVSIFARPPGKQPRSISLLSGGEKTLTCVALLLAIFRNRPSPFCILDEVDAALDETNIDRFITVLNNFMDSTQFVVVTHSKRTMTCADTLYGVTMQESGVSKRVSVRFEDVGENGEIRIATASARTNASRDVKKAA